MKDKHTINLILISSKRVILSFGVCSWWINSSSKCFIFSFPEFKFPRSSRRNLHLNHRKAHLIFSSFILSHHPFVTEVLHGGSSWFNSFFKSSSRFCWRISSIFFLASRSVINSPYSFEVEFCISSFFSVIQSFPFVAGYHLMILRCYL